MSQSGVSAEPRGASSAPDVVRRKSPATLFGPRAAWTVTVMLASGWGLWFAQTEGSPSNIAYTVAVSLTLATFLTLLTRRALFAAVVIAGLVGIITAAAMVKQRTMDSVVHAYDLYFYATWSTVSYLWSDFRGYVLALLASVLALLATGSITWRLDPLRVRRRRSGILLGMLVLASWGFAELKGERRHMQFHFNGLYVSSFYASWGETIETMLRGQLVEAASAAPGPLFDIPGSCTPAEKPPHIILIHQESVVPPEILPGLAYDRSVDGFFRSDDGRLNKLRVETYGGASWLTEFSILAGVSTHSFGGMRQFVQLVMQGKLKDTLPEALQRCGYRNVIFYPMLRNFVSNDKFYASIGLKEIHDLKDQGAKRVNERDRFYYANALDHLERHLKTSDRPVFSFIQTMAAHWPYNETYEPHESVPGGAPGTHPEMHEYLRRVSLAKLDMDWLWREIQRRFPGERILLVHYGDHHPMSTRLLLGFGEDVEAEDVALRPDSVGFITYYAMRGHNWRVPELPAVEALDVPYLGSLMLRAAGLPLSDAHNERLRLMAACSGRYYTCPARDRILAFHRRLIDSGLMKAR